MRIGTNFITDRREFTPSGGVPERWYLFRIPIAEYSDKVGDIPDFKSIRFIRMFLEWICRFRCDAFCKTGIGA